MSALFRKKSPLDKRRKKVEKRLSSVNRDLATLSKVADIPGNEDKVGVLNAADSPRFSPIPEPRAGNPRRGTRIIIAPRNQESAQAQACGSSSHATRKLKSSGALLSE